MRKADEHDTPGQAVRRVLLFALVATSLPGIVAMVVVLLLL